MNNGMLVVLSAPSGCGKDTVFRQLCTKRSDLVESISATTRKPRQGEVDGVNYYFVSIDEFKNLISSNGLIEYAVYNNCYYGTPVKGVEDAVKNGKICFLIIEVNGAQRVKELFPDSVSIFLLPPSLEILEERLRGRDSDDDQIVKSRLDIANVELSYKDKYDYQVVNDNLDICVEEINEILNNELNKRVNK